uniref:Uncharacterized protein n=1 Tax=Arundo donax TaxID=35708 RepID=A0A0A9B6U4_ARUDO
MHLSSNSFSRGKAPELPPEKPSSIAVILFISIIAIFSRFCN